MKAIAAVLLTLCAALPAGADPTLPAAVTNQADKAASRQLLVMRRLPSQHYLPDAAYFGRNPNGSGRVARRRAGTQLANAHGLKLVDDWPMPVIGIDCYVMEHDGGASLTSVLAALSRDERVMWAQPMHEFHGLDGGDQLYAVQPAAKYWRLCELHKIRTERGVPNAVNDSGIDAHDPDPAGRIPLRQNFVDATPDAAEAHGSAVAGISAARAGDWFGIAGVTPDARLLAFRACWPDRRGATRYNTFKLGKALNFAIMNRAKIINLSLSGPADRLLQTLLDVAAQRGMAVIGAVDPNRPDGGFPASYPGVIAVAMAANGRVPAPADVLFGPGQDIPTTAGQHAVVQGPPIG